MIKDDLLLEKLKYYDNDAIIKLIDHHINGRNAERNRKILKRRFIDGIYYEPLAEEFDLSVRQVQNIVYSAIKKFLIIL